ncbi:MAG: glycosyltransferase family 2 protein [Candidatus Aphodosoma sp.]
MNKPLISVVMPAYNAAKYITESISSVLNQSLKNFEIIVVDDCSTDDTWKIINELVATDNRLKICRLDKNSGSAKYPREVAVSMANADWICWIDADDIVLEDYLEKLYCRTQNTNADIVCSQMIAFQNNTNNVQYALPDLSLHNNGDIIIPGKVAVMKTIGTWLLNANGFLVKKFLWQATSLFLNIDANWMDADDVSTREMLLSANKVAFVDAVYYYRIHPDAITKKLSVKKFHTLITDSYVIDLIDNAFGNKSHQARLARNQYVSRILSFMRLAVVNKSHLTNDDFSEIIALIKKHFSSCSAGDIIHSDLKPMLKLIMLLPFNSALAVVNFINRK